MCRNLEPKYPEMRPEGGKLIDPCEHNMEGDVYALPPLDPNHEFSPEAQRVLDSLLLSVERFKRNLRKEREKKDGPA